MLHVFGSQGGGSKPASRPAFAGYRLVLTRRTRGPSKRISLITLRATASEYESGRGEDRRQEETDRQTNDWKSQDFIILAIITLPFPSFSFKALKAKNIAVFRKLPTTKFENTISFS